MEIQILQAVGFAKNITVDDNIISTKVDFNNNKLAFTDCYLPSRLREPGSWSVRKASVHKPVSFLPSVAETGRSLNPAPVSIEKYQTLQLTPGNRRTSNALWALVVTLSGPLLQKPNIPCVALVFEKCQRICANQHILLFKNLETHWGNVLVHPFLLLEACVTNEANSRCNVQIYPYNERLMLLPSQQQTDSSVTLPTFGFIQPQSRYILGDIILFSHISGEIILHLCILLAKHIVGW